MTTVYGGTANGYWRAKLTYDASSSADTYTLTTESCIETLNGCQEIATGDGIDAFGSISFSLAATSKTTQTASFSGPLDNEGSAIMDRTLSWSKTHSTQNVRLTLTAKVNNCRAWVGGSSQMITGTSTAYGPSSSTYISIPAKTSYTVSYNANGGSGAPGNQTKWHNEALTLSSTVPTRSGWTFVGWAKSSTATSTAYAAGASYTGNAALALYAVWKRVITVSYNANGGSGAPANQQVTIYNSTTSGNITITTARPSRGNFAFLGWAGSSTATTVTHNPGSSYSFSSDTVLYAVWDAAPIINSLTVVRSDSNGDPADEGTYALVTCEWDLDGTLGDTATLSGTITPQSGGSATAFTFDTGGSGSGSVTATALVSPVDPDMQYTVLVTAANGNNTSKRSTILTRAFFVMDWKAGGQAVGIGRAAPANGLEVGYETVFDDDVTVLGDASFGSKVDVLGNLAVRASNISRSETPDANVYSNAKLRLEGSSGTALSELDNARSANGDATSRWIAYNQDANGSMSYGIMQIVKPATNVNYDGWFTFLGKYAVLKHGISGSDSMFQAERTDTGTKAGFGVGSGGINHGVYSHTLNNWIIYADTANVWVNKTINRSIGSSGISYIDGNKGNAALYLRKGTGNVWYPAVTLDTTSGGSWSIGNYNSENLLFSWASKANRDSGTNSTTLVNLPNNPGTIPVPVQLYYNATGTDGTVSLSQTAANFNYLRIYYKKNGDSNACGSTDVYAPNGKRASLVIGNYASSNHQVVAKYVNISGQSITKLGACSITATHGTTPYLYTNETALYIYRVEGWK